MNSTNQKRLFALDAFRGLTIAFMILVNTPGSWSYVYAPLRHAKWHGCTATDLVFPFFLFIVGVAMRFSFHRYKYEPTPVLIKKILGRTVTIFLIGLALNAFPFIRQDWDWSTLRIMGVLQRIALAYGAAALICIYFNSSKRWIISGGVLVTYWMIMWVFGGNDPFGIEMNLARKIDLALLGSTHLYHPVNPFDPEGLKIAFDPEGLFSTFPAIVTVILGFQVGTLIQTGANYIQTIKKLIVWSIAGIVVGWLWGFVFPINKQLWTSSYVLYTGGWATLFLAFFIWLIDVKGFQKAVQLLVIFGTNSIFVFAASGLWVKSIIRFKFTFDEKTVNGYTYLYKTIFVPLAGNLNGSLLFALFHVLMWWLLLYWMYRKKIFIKI